MWKSFVLGWFVSTALFLIGCAVTPMRTARPHGQEVHAVERVLVDAKFDEADQRSIIRAVERWNVVLNGVTHLEPRVAKLSLAESGIMIMRIDSSAPYIPEPQEGHTLAFVERIGGRHVWVVRDRILSTWVEPVMLHELGHILGAVHHDGGLMNWEFTTAAYACVDVETARDVSESLNVPLSRLRYCGAPAPAPRYAPAEDEFTAYPPLN